MEEGSVLAERILGHVADALICADRSGAIIRWNRAATTLFSYSAEEILGQGIDRIAHFADGEQRFHAMVSNDFARS
jgi:PAS domain S-box-containing protein